MNCRVRRVSGRGIGGAAALVATLAAQAALAQAPDGLTLTTVDPPRGAAATAYQDATRGRAQTQATYATDVQGGRLTVDSRASRPTATLPRAPVLDGNLAMLVVVGGLALALFLWLRFGGGGLFARTPAAAPPPPRVTPEGWDAQGNSAPGGDLLARAAAMVDRRAALVLLLRACLLHAAAVTGTRLARSDTERRVLARLPGHFAPRALLADLLARAELAHYGGRDVSEADFAASLTAARHLLGAAHG